MNLELKLKIRKAIDKIFVDTCEDDLWQEFIHPQLIDQMVNAAELVFDSSQDAQVYLEKENS